MEQSSFILNDVIEMHYDLVSGAPVFKGMRVPIQIFFDYLEDKQSIEEFLEGYPTVTREQTEKVMNMLTSPVDK